MKILIVNTYLQGGGAAVASCRLAQALRRDGLDVTMLSMHRKFPHFYWERFVIWASNLFSRKHLFVVSIANAGEDITRLPEFREADIIHLHWINQGFISLDCLRRILDSGKPVVWTLHDMWPLTAICHHAYTCTAYETHCRNCHFLRHPSATDLSAKVFDRKAEVLKGSDMHVVAVSQWLADKVRHSALLKDKPLCVIPNTLSTRLFPMLDKAECRRIVGVPDKNILIFGAAKLDDPIKGFGLFVKSLRCLFRSHPEYWGTVHVLLFGNIKSDKKTFLSSIQVPCTYCGSIETGNLAQLYSASDAVVSSSYYETFGQTLIEAQACGCVAVSWNNSGQADIIRHKVNGYLAEYLSEADLAEGIRWALDEGQKVATREQRRQMTIERFSENVVGQMHVQLYEQLIDNKKKNNGCTINQETAP